MLEQKVKKALEEIGFSKKVAYKVGLVDILQEVSIIKNTLMFIVKLKS